MQRLRYSWQNVSAQSSPTPTRPTPSAFSLETKHWSCVGPCRCPLAEKSVDAMFRIVHRAQIIDHHPSPIPIRVRQLHSLLAVERCLPQNKNPPAVRCHTRSQILGLGDDEHRIVVSGSTSEPQPNRTANKTAVIQRSQSGRCKIAQTKEYRGPSACHKAIQPLHLPPIARRKQCER